MADTNTYKKDKLTLKPWLIGFLVLLGIVLVLFAYYEIFWKNSENSKITLSEKKDGILYDSENGVTYYELSESYEARYRVSNDYYGKIGKKKLYQLAYKDKSDKAVTINGTLYLAEHPDDGGAVYAAETVSVSDLSGFKGETVYVCSDAMDELVVTFTSLSGDSADKFINEYLEGNVYKGNGVPYETFKLRITSEEYKWLYYILYLVRCDNGDYYVYGATDRTGYTVDPTFFHASLGGAVK